MRGKKRFAAGAIVVLVLGLYFSGRLDTLLYNVGLNFHTCAKNGFGTVFCGSALTDYQNRIRQASARARQALSRLPRVPTTSASTATAPTATTDAHGNTVFVLSDPSGNRLSITVPEIIDPATPSSQYVTAPSGSRFIAVVEILNDLGPGTISDDANPDTSVIGTDGQAYTATYGPVQECTNFNAGVFTLANGDSEQGCVVVALPDGVSAARVQFTLLGTSSAEWRVRP